MDPVVTEAILRLKHERLEAEPWPRNLHVRLHPIARRRLIDENVAAAGFHAGYGGLWLAGMPVFEDAALNPEQILVEAT